MNWKLQIIISAAGALVLTHSGLAQDKPDLRTNSRDDARVGVPHARRPNHLNQAAKASDVIGMTVENYLDEKLGKVKDLALDMESGRIVLVIMSAGGFMGMGDRLTAVPPEIFYNDAAYKVLRLLDTDKEKLKGAPKFAMSNWAECCNSNHLYAVYGYYDEEPVLGFIQNGNEVLDGPPNVVATRLTYGIRETDRVSSVGQGMIPVSRLSKIQQSSKLTGMTVLNLQNEKLGRVQNILVDLPSGRIVAVIISSGRFLRLDDELSAVPPTALRFTAGEDTLQLDASKEMLSLAPHFKANQWPDFTHPSYVGAVYRAYHVEPYFATFVTAEDDDMWRKIRDSDNRPQTLLVQGKNQADLDTTAQIRKAIIAANETSKESKNVEIITMDGRVTLRGPVDSIEVKNLIGKIAVRIARPENMDNQLEVKLTASNNK
jgi:sporulation protein YlmC with PRC-barrel domain